MGRVRQIPPQPHQRRDPRRVDEHRANDLQPPTPKPRPEPPLQVRAHVRSKVAFDERVPVDITCKSCRSARGPPHIMPWRLRWTRSPAWYFKINESTLMMDTYRGEGRRVLALSRVRLEDVGARQLRGVFT